MKEDLILKQISEILEGSRHQQSLLEIYEARRDALDLSDNQVAKILHVKYNSLKRIIDKEAKKIDYLLLLKLSRFLNIEPQELANIYHSDDTGLAAELGSVVKRTYIAENFDLKTLRSIGLIKSTTDFDAIEDRIKTYFGLERLTDYDHLMTGVMFSQTKRSPHEKMRAFWVKSAHAMFKKIANPNEYDRDALKSLVPKIRPYTQNIEKGFLIVARALFNIGVTVIYQPYLTNTQVRGGTFVVDGKPCVVITDYNKSYPTLWFALLHELSHVLFDLEVISKSTFHLSGEPDMFLVQEEKANEFARNLLLPEAKSKYIRRFINHHYMVQKYADENDVHPSIIYAFYQFDQYSDGNSYWGAYRKHFPKVSRATEHINLIPWEQDTIDETVEKLKTTLTQFV